MLKKIKDILQKGFDFLKSLFKSHPKKSVFILLVIVFAIFFFKGDGPKIEMGRLENGNLEEIVTVSGTVSPSQESYLTFEKSGKIQSVNVKVGDKVSAGQVLATINGGNDYASVLNATAGLEAAEANLEAAENGPTQFELTSKQEAYNSALQDLALANNSAGDTLRNIYTSLSDILGYKLNGVFTYSSSYKLNGNNCDQSLQSKIEIERYNLDQKMSSLNALAQSFYVDNGSSQEEINKKVDAAGLQAYSTAIDVQEMLNDLDKIFNNACVLSFSDLNSYRSSISSARNAVNTTISSITSLKSQISSLRSALVLADNALAEAKAGPTNEKLKSLRAAVDSAKANLISAKFTNAKNVLVAPFDGTITQVNINLGEISSPGSPAINLISSNNLELKVKLSEIDLVKVKSGNKARVYLDTYGNTATFDGVVTQVYPAATKEGNTSVYYAKIDFSSVDDRVRSGMNGTADIVTISKENVDYITAKYLKVDGSINKVKVVKDANAIKKVTLKDNDSNIVWKNIEIGMRDSKGRIEVLSGISKDDNLVPIDGLSATTTNN